MYSYVGNPFTSFSDSLLIPASYASGMRVTATLLFETALAPDMPFHSIT
ncbi:MAG: hypothetical protein JWN13_3313, partial [Betaproteobacteria bacterium]|nr:hypothetical protein [Betaproteobacteria bacterium]